MHPPGQPPAHDLCLAAGLSVAAARDRALVLEAIGISCSLRTTVTGHELWVATEDEPRARAEIDRFLEENPRRSPPPTALPVYRHALWGVSGYALVLILVMAAALYRVADRSWVSRGILETGSLAGSDWWRVFTALTLHADLGHLLANLAFGILFAYPASQLVGVGVAWLAIVLGAGAANAVDILLHPPGHTALGASTAVFVALGLTSAFSWRRRATGLLTPMQRAAPLVAGIALLAFTGSAGEQTDVQAHLAGFVIGLGVGTALAHLRLPAPGRPAPQWLAGGLALTALLVAWIAALG
jgi:rhomboid protease GluP